MLQLLSIRNMLLVEAADLRFRPGLNVLTGETGAGKSILLDCLGFVLGWRTRAEARAGAQVGEVTAAFICADGHPAADLVAEAGLPASDELILRRTVTADGRRQAWINDRRVTAETLRAIGDTLVALHGQHDDRDLLDARGHRALLDAFAGTDLAPVRAAWAARAAAARALDEARAALTAAGADRAWLAHATAELDVFGPEPGEEPALDLRRRQLRAAEQIRDDVAAAAAALGPEGAEGALLLAMRRLEAAAGKAEGGLDAALDGIGRTLSELAEVARAVGHAAADLEADPSELERVEERLFALRGLARKHQVAPDAVAALAETLRVRLRALEESEDGLTRLDAQFAEADGDYRSAASAASAARRAAAGRLEARVATELAPLKLERAVFSVEIDEAEPGPDGGDRVRFSVATNPGAPPGPLDRIASGGELSRFMLALKVCVSARTSGRTLVFDEIDRGVGGATADAVGRRLQALGAVAQVIVVTHSPQVAARGAWHWQVGKAVGRGVTRTEIAGLEDRARVEEIARMLAGDTITDEARAAARALLDA